MSPTFIEGERGVVILGSPGGSAIPSMVLLGLMHWMTGADATAIVTAPRLHHQFRPDAVFAETAALSDDERSGLVERGHAIEPWPATIGNLQVVTWDFDSGRVEAASDPRRAGGATVR
jgi:gamma-glutamyltranspeptidase/glutathione hydrolase